MNGHHDDQGRKQDRKKGTKKHSGSGKPSTKRAPSVTISLEEVSEQNGEEHNPDTKHSHENGVSNESKDSEVSKEIVDKKSDTGDVTKSEEEKSSEKKEGTEGETSDIEDDDDDELFDARRGESPEPEVIESFRKLSVSPVQTPCVLRPLTRGESRYEIGDKMTDILMGHVHRMCQPESTVIEIYVSSGYTGKKTYHCITLGLFSFTCYTFCQIVIFGDVFSRLPLVCILFFPANGTL